MRDRRPERHAVHDANALASLLHVTDERERAAAGAGSVRDAVRDHPLFVLAVLVVLMTSVWMIGTPRSAGPDEPSHVVRGGGLVRGQLDGEPFPQFGFQYAYDLPGHVGFPDPICFAFEEFAPASCANDLEPAEGSVAAGTRAANYPIWGHLPAGLGTFAPADWSAWAARAADAVIPLGLVVAALALARRRGAMGTGSVLLALTPMAWFLFAVVNPSGMVIGGGIGLWVVLTSGAHHGRLAGWLAAASWAAMVLPRRDGMVWASLIVAIVVLTDERRIRDWWRMLGRGPAVVVAVSTLATLAWASRSDTNAAIMLFVAPLAPIVAWAVRQGWNRLRGTPAPLRALYPVALTGLAGAAGLVVMTRRDDGFDRRALELVIGRTGGDVTEAIGLLGWLDTPVPITATFAWLVGLGVLAGVSVAAGTWINLARGGLVVVVAIFSSWVLTMLQNDATGTYWQGRYYLPLLVGVPIVLGTVDIPAAVGRRIGAASAMVGLGVVNAALYAALRRWGVGTAGSLFPWDWDTYEAPLPPVLLLAVHVLASIGLVGWVLTQHDRQLASPAPGDR